MRWGTIGRVQFYGKDAHPFTHSIKYGKGLIRPDAAVAGRKADRRLAERGRQERPQIPGFVKVTN